MRAATPSVVHVDLRDAEGAKRVEESELRGASQYALLKPLFAKQKNLTFCGIQSTVIALNLLRGNDNNHHQQRPTEEQAMFSLEETKVVLNEEDVKRKGITLQQCANLLLSHGASATVCRHADETDVNTFRREALEVFRSRPSPSSLDNKTKSKRQTRQQPPSCMLVNYHMYTLGQDYHCGHISPIAAYHAESDSLLLLDVWPSSPEFWVSVEDLWKAMDTIDNDSGRKRGYVIARC
jgi:hypothetical protein